MSELKFGLLGNVLFFASLGCAPSTASSAPAAPAAAAATAPQSSSAAPTPGGYAVHGETVAAAPLAVARGQAWAGNIGPQIMSLSPKVNAHLEQLGVQRGHNVVIYFDTGGSDQWTSAPGIPIEVGFQLREPLPKESDSVFRSQTPAGQVATTTHVGSYDRMGDAHVAVRDWCAQNGKALTGQNWEVYGPWSDHPEELRTDVYYLLE